MSAKQALIYAEALALSGRLLLFAVTSWPIFHSVNVRFDFINPIIKIISELINNSGPSKIVNAELLANEVVSGAPKCENITNVR